MGSCHLFQNAEEEEKKEAEHDEGATSSSHHDHHVETAEAPPHVATINNASLMMVEPSHPHMEVSQLPAMESGEAQSLMVDSMGSTGSGRDMASPPPLSGGGGSSSTKGPCVKGSSIAGCSKAGGDKVKARRCRSLLTPKDVQALEEDFMHGGTRPTSAFMRKVHT